MKINGKILPEIIYKGFKERLDYSDYGTWNSQELDEKDIPDIRHFYNNSFRRGLIEYPEKRPHPKPYSTNKFSPLFFINNYLKIILSQKTIRKQLENYYYTYSTIGVDYPKYDPDDIDFYYNMDGYAFNHNLRKYSEFILTLRQFIKMKNLNVCEIGGGYGGLTELMIKNNLIKNYYIIDLFETLSVSMTYLIDKIKEPYSCNLINSEKDMEEIEGDFNIIFIPVKVYNNINNFLKENFEIDIFINSNSFVEMSNNDLNDYFSFIHQFNHVYLFSYNKIKRVEQGKMMSAYGFPYDSNWQDIYFKEDKRYGDLVRLSYR